MAGSADKEAPGVIVSGLAAGTYVFVVTAVYTSVDGESRGSNEASATIIPITGPDLLIINAGITPQAIIPGKKVDVSCTVVNQGTTTAVESTLKIYLSIDQTFEASDIFLAEGRVSAINAGDSIKVSGNGITVSRFNRPGEYFILFVADADGVVQEFYENNNVIPIPVSLSITAGVNEISALASLKLFPVPANTHATISYSGTYNGMCTILCYSADGRILRRDQVFLSDGLSIPVDVSQWAEGVYFVRFQTDTESMVRQLIISH